MQILEEYNRSARETQRDTRFFQVIMAMKKIKRVLGEGEGWGHRLRWGLRGVWGSGIWAKFSVIRKSSQVKTWRKSITGRRNSKSKVLRKDGAFPGRKWASVTGIWKGNSRKWVQQRKERTDLTPGFVGCRLWWGVWILLVIGATGKFWCRSL